MYRTDVELLPGAGVASMACRIYWCATCCENTKGNIYLSYNFPRECNTSSILLLLLLLYNTAEQQQHVFAPFYASAAILSPSREILLLAVAGDWDSSQALYLFRESPHLMLLRWRRYSSGSPPVLGTVVDTRLSP